MLIPVRSQFFWPCNLLLTVIMLLLGNVGNASFSSGVALAQPATNQPEIKTDITNISNQDVRSYAAVVLAIEPIRLKYYDLARQQMAGKMPQDLCLGNQKANIPNGLEDICNSYMQESTAIIEANDLTPGQFDAITKQAQTDKALRDRIQQHLRQQQKAKP
ncbi:MAG: DUF4168 domain-containing protein [Aphanocapsa sp. GSE-SYN-MK-11-07L]|jgi:hypothetical protein|nr:DUF4168 domain-containing protein [Aphanocapsa sp. GSE-SYN-MK-11-07L]